MLADSENARESKAQRDDLEMKHNNHGAHTKKRIMRMKNLEKTLNIVVLQQALKYVRVTETVRNYVKPPLHHFYPCPFLAPWRKVSWGYPRTAPRTRERIQGLSGRKSETISCLSPAVNVIQAFSGVLSEVIGGLVSRHTCHMVTLSTCKSVVRWD